MPTIAEEIIRPADPGTFRAVFLYVGQGESTLLVIPDGLGRFIYVLVDINAGAAQGGLDVVRLLEHLLPREAGKPVLDVFMNTHPHNDHLCGLAQLRKRIKVREVWHTGFTPSDRHAQAYAELTGLVDDVERGGGRVWEYRGTRDIAALGSAWYNVLSPADHTKEEIDQLKGQERDSRIHDYCGVMRFAFGNPERRVLLTGDADKVAWKDYILGASEYHKDRVPADVLSAAHHGSRSFFKENEDDPEPYTRHIELIGPTWVVISSPRQEDSPHGHPHDDAIALYQDFVEAERIYVLGERPECRIYDVTADGTDVLDTDNGRLVDAYPLNGDDDGRKGSAAAKVEAPAVITTSRLDPGRPMGGNGD